jgi:RadC-like JAB domain
VCSDKLQARFGGGPGEKAEKSDLARGLPYGINIVSTGSLTASVVHPREVYKPAILSNAAAIICGHNHPSGAPRSA